jgi:peptide/nickel transport system permease protein
MKAARHAAVGLGLGLLAAAALLVLLAPWLPLPAPADTDLAQRLLPPGAPGHLLGTDHLGRDMLARLLFAMRASLAVAVLGTLVAGVLGTAAGLTAGYRAGRLDDALMRSADVVLAFPYVLLALALVAALGPSLRNAALAVAIVNVPFFARTVRGSALALRGEAFVEVARLSGHGDLRIALREVLPNALPVLLIALATTLGWMILETAGLSFLGLGAQPPQADLGSMLGDGRRFLATAPHVALVPGVALFALSLAVHLAADALRDRLDPQRAPRAGRTSEAAPEGSAAERGEDTDTRALLEVEGLVVAIPGAGRVVDGVDLRVARGEAVALVGESGSGKTVTALSILGLSPAPGAHVVAGRIRVAGQDLGRLDAEGCRRLRATRLGFVPQDPGSGLNPVRRIGAQLVDALRAGGRLTRSDALARARALLAEAELPDPHEVLDAWPHELSGGMRQRVLLAMALASAPDLLVADEPTTALDVTVQREILTRLDQARRARGRGLLLVTHDLGVVAELCDRVVVLREGRVVESGAVAEVLRAPRAPYTRALLESVPRLDEPERLLRAAEASA